jgi:hypothetical protein
VADEVREWMELIIPGRRLLMRGRGLREAVSFRLGWPVAFEFLVRKSVEIHLPCVWTWSLGRWSILVGRGWKVMKDGPGLVSVYPSALGNLESECLVATGQLLPEFLPLALLSLAGPWFAVCVVCVGC